ncbi:MAG: epoxyqueuosine reductase QueH [Bacteroidetes bacterium]|nr:epoxyqueuosine reductase QueH [Bacteroidota bacterium]
MKKILLHTCCGPCFTYPLKYLKTSTDFEIVVYFYNPNIHPYKEFVKRKNTLEHFCKENSIELITEDYGLLEWTKYVSNSLDKREDRCSKCYEIRLEKSAKKTRELGIETMSTTLLYSTYQYHNQIKKLGENIVQKLANDHQPNINFFHHDFREGWKEGFELFKPFKKQGLFMQNYCGCIFSEEERFRKKPK